MNLDEYLDSPSDSDWTADSPPASNKFATAETIIPCSQSINLHLRGMGLRGDLDFISSAPTDVASVLNVMDTLIRQKHGDRSESSRLENDVAQLKADNDLLSKELRRAQKQLEDREREVGNLLIKLRKAESGVNAEAARVTRELEQLQGSHKRLCQLHSCWQQELRRKEREYSALQDKLRFHLQERKKEASRACVEIAGLTQQQGHQQAPTSRAARAKQRLSGSVPDEDLSKRIVEFYERQKQELLEENQALKRGMLDLQTEYKELLNQLQDGKNPRSYMSMRRFADSIDGSFTTDTNLANNIPERPSSALAPKEKLLREVVDEAGVLVNKSAHLLRISGQPGENAAKLATQLQDAHALILEQQLAMQRWRDVMF